MLDNSWINRFKAASSVKAEVQKTIVSDDSLAEAKANAKVTRAIESAVAEASKEITEAGIDHSAKVDASLVTNGWPQKAEDSGLLISNDFVLDDSQVAAIKTIIGSQYSALIGAAGTGKTTLVKHILAKIIYGDKELGLEPTGIRQLAGDQGPSIAIVAFTGIASQVIRASLPDWLAPACKTIHTLLEYKPVFTEGKNDKGETVETQIFMPSRHRGNKLDHNVVVIDESSMVGLALWHNILDALRPGTRVIMIGDLNQLKPVADQTMFAYALAESVRPGSKWKTAELTKIHRQKEPAANRIIETAHSILNGHIPTLDESNGNPNWRVIGFKLDSNPLKAGAQIIKLADMARKSKIDASIDPAQPFIYDPYKDRIMTAGNGEDSNDTKSAVQQVGINEVLCRIIEPPTAENPVYIIDAGASRERRFAVGHRVMATKNEPPSTKDRVTNGMTGRITKIETNPAWSGVVGSVGPEESVKAFRAEMAKKAFSMANLNTTAGLIEDFSTLEFDISGTKKAVDAAEQEKEGFGSGPSSHMITVMFDNGAERVFRSKAQVDQLRLAYATTVHKAQGSQCNTAIIVVHHAVKSQLSREWLYTAVTRAQKRVILLYTDFGLSNALAKQQIFGSSLREKIQRYAAAMANGTGGRGGIVRLTVEDRMLDESKSALAQGFEEESVEEEVIE